MDVQPTYTCIKPYVLACVNFKPTQSTLIVYEKRREIADYVRVEAIIGYRSGEL